MNINDFTPEMIDAITEALEENLKLYYKPSDLETAYIDCFEEMLYHTSGTFGFVNAINDVLEAFDVKEGFGDELEWYEFDLLCTDLCEKAMENVKESVK